MEGCISVINSGSSSIKFSLFGDLHKNELSLVFDGHIKGIGGAPHFQVVDRKGTILAEQRWDEQSTMNHGELMGYIIDWIRENRQERGLELRGVGHRVVHGGAIYSAPVLIDDQVINTLEDFVPLAPLHQPHNLGSIRAIQKHNPEIPQVACFDTAFHRTNPPVAQQFGLPRELTDAGIRRYGFHGLSYEYISRRLAQLAPETARGRVIVAHLGSGASLCGLINGISVASSMGFSAMDGLMMGTRPGNLDPGVVLYLLQEKGMQATELVDLLYRQSGLLGVSGISNDMQVLLKSDDPQASEAIDLFLYRIQRGIGALAAVLGGLDGLVFTAGIGEHAVEIRRRVCDAASWLGVSLDHAANEQGQERLHTGGSSVTVWKIPTDEELMIATHTRDVLAHSAV